MRGISLLAEQRLASEEGLVLWRSIFIGLFTYLFNVVNVGLLYYNISN
jgi:hypothetical protein